MTGRLMKIADRFMAPPLAICPALALLRLLAFVLHADPAARHEPQVTVGHDGIAGLTPAGKHRLAPADPVHGDGTHLDGLVRLHHEHVRPLLAGLHRDRRDDDRLRIRGQRHDDVDELAGPEPPIGVRKRPFDANRAGVLVNGVVDERRSGRPRRALRRSAASP